MKAFGKFSPPSTCLSKSSLTNTKVAGGGGQPSIERLHAAIDRAYAQVKFPYIFHCEDDWEFFRPGFIQESYILLNALPKASVIRLTSREQDRSLLRTSVQEINGIRFCQPQSNCYKAHYGYTYNPGLRRLADYKQVAPLSKIKGGDAEVGVLFLHLGFVTAHLEIPACTHIGWEQRTHHSCLKKKTVTNFLRKKWLRLRLTKLRLLDKVKKPQ